MKKQLLFLILALISLISIDAQIQTIKIKNNDIGAKIKESFYVDVNNNEFRHGEYKYIYKGHLQAEGQFLNNQKSGLWKYSPNKNFLFQGIYENNQRQGKWIYFKNGDTLAVLNYFNDRLEGKQLGYKEGSIKSISIYKNGKIHGNELVYHDNGRLLETSNYLQGKLHGDYRVFNSSGEILCEANFYNNHPIDLQIIKDDKRLVYFNGQIENGTGAFENFSFDQLSMKREVAFRKTYSDSLLSGEFISYNNNGSIKHRGQFQNNYMIDKWLFYDKDGNLEKAKQYDQSQKLTSDSTEKVSTEYLYNYTNVEDMPLFDNKDMNGFRMFIALRLRYPEIAAEKNISGRVYVQFTINNLGELVDAVVVKGVDPSLDKEALRVINLSPFWTPGILLGKPAKFTFTFPVVFVLN
jgi:TonB family protein